MAVFEMRNARKAFGALEVLKGVSLKVEKGEVVSIIGPSGGGKSTMLRCATLLETMDSGTLAYGENIAAREENGKSVYAGKAALAQVRLNGKDLGVVWTAPWQVELTGALKAGKNELEIEVTNAWANRLVGDAGLPPEQRVTVSNMQFEKGKRTLKAFQGFASEDALQPSGLVGPVRIELWP